MFSETTSITSVIVDLITSDPRKYMKKGGGVGMTQASMHKIHSGGESNRVGGGVEAMEWTW